VEGAKFNLHLNFAIDNLKRLCIVFQERFQKAFSRTVC